MRKVLHIASYYPPHVGGVEQTAKDIVDSLTDGFSHTVICFHDQKKTEVDRQGAVKVIRAGTKWKIASQPISFSFKKLLKEYVKTEKPDVIHFHFPNPLAAGALLKCKSDAKLIVHWHSDIIKQKLLKKFFKGQTLRLLDRANAIIATSPIYAKHSEFLPQFQDKITIIPSCINENLLEKERTDDEAVKAIRNTYPSKKLCFFVGRHVPYKGLEYLLKGLPYLSEDVQLLLGGTGPLTDELKKLAASDSRVTFLGMVARDALKNYFAASDIFVFPSITKNEAFGLALAEGMYFAKPAVTFTIEGSGVNYVSVDGLTGIECENRNSRQFAEAINQLSGDEELRETLGNAAKARVEELFLFSTFQKNIQALYGGLFS